MADVKISALPLASTPLAGTEVLPIVQSATTDQVSVANLTAGRAVSAASLTLTTTPLAVGSGGTGLSTLTAGYIPYGAGTSAFNNSANLFWDNTNSRLGVGTTTPAFKVEIASGYNNGLHLKDTTGTVYGGYFVEATTMAFVTRSNHGLRFGTNDTTRMTLDASGNLGIGTTSPSFKLNVVSSTDTTFAIFAGTARAVRIATTATTASIEGVDQSGVASYQPLQVGGSTLNFAISGTSKLTIDASGNLTYRGLQATGAAAPTIASATTIAPTTPIVFISGTTAIATITAPSPISAGGGQITLIPTGIFTTTTAGNIALASTAVVSRALIMTYDTTTAKWYPSY
jgi:hypothetical protein